MKQLLLLIDGTAEIYRSYYAFKDLRTSKGVPSGAAFGFALMLRRLLDAEKPTHGAVAFDLPAPTFRHEAFSEYKATRKPPPPEMISQIPAIKEIVSGHGLRAIELAGYEADDIIATLTTKALQLKIGTVIVGQDKDFYQLLQENVSLYNPRKGGKRIDVAAAEEILGVPPAAIPDLLALMGDSSDNIPGVEGIGAKIARRLIERFGTLDLVYQNIEAIENKRVRKSIESQREQAYMSRWLATMHRDVPLSISIDQLRVQSFDHGPLKDLFQRLGFTSLSRTPETQQPRQSGLFDDENE